MGLLSYRKWLALFFILVLALSVRALTANFIRAHLDDPGWFPSGIYGAFDRQAQNWLDGRAPIFWIDDPSHTDAAIYPPGYPLWLAFVYTVTGARSPGVVQNIQWVLDAFSVLLVIGVGVTAFGWRVGLLAGVIAAAWPLLAIYGAVPLPDAPTSWIVLGGAWALILAARRKNLFWALAAGALIGISCWFRANAMLLGFVWAIALLVFVQESWRRRTVLAGAVVLSSLLMISPVMIRNASVFRTFVPPGLGTGTNLLEGIGETERGSAEFGAPGSDQQLLEQERAAAKVPPDARFELHYPDGIQRDRLRTQRALQIIRQHPFWYAGTVMRRMAAVLKYAGEPSGVYGTAGINVTSRKSLPPHLQGGLIAFFVTVLGMLQSVLRFVLLPLIVLGVFFGLRREWRTSGLILATVFYYLVIGSLIHTHIRYGLPMHALLTIFAAMAATQLVAFIRRRHRSRA
jgi:4-amino-4-deoxy-L-arabinose transferase-like glycosyltransferase